MLIWGQVVVAYWAHAGGICFWRGFGPIARFVSLEGQGPFNQGRRR